MADEIEIPSPSVFLARSNSPPARAPPPTSSASAPKQPRRQSTSKPTKKAAVKKSAAPDPGAPAKPKQFKSRNGCSTCKQKRLKCDETKPACQQCQKKGLPCGGYKKAFKWRPFEESNVKVIIDRQKEDLRPVSRHSPHSASTSPIDGGVALSAHEDNAEHCRNGRILPSTKASVESTSPTHLASPPVPESPVVRHFQRDNSASSLDPPEPDPPPDVESSILQDVPASTVDGVLGLMASSFPAQMMLPFRGSPMIMSAPSPEQAQSPSLTDLLAFNDTEFMIGDRDGDFMNMSFLSDTIDSDVLGQLDPAPDSDDFNRRDVDEIFDNEPVDFASSMDLLSMPSMAGDESDPATSYVNRRSPRLLSQPFIAVDSPEALFNRFDDHTAGILSIMNGPDENPWRSLIRPLARDSPALSYAILAMTAFHMSGDFPQFRAAGQRYKQLSIHNIRVGLRDSSIDLERSIATALALGWAESWDQHTSLGNEHIKGAQALVKQALNIHKAKPLHGLQLQRLKFLCNAWVYMDVIARLTAVDSNDSVDFDNTFLFPPDSPLPPRDVENVDRGFGINFGIPLDARLDALMGCANTLFPIIGRVANLVKKVFRTKSNSAAVISQASMLKTQLEEWMPPGYIDKPQDPSTDPQHTVQTAEAYRWATLLHLHQAVPEIPSPTSEWYAQKVLQFLATVPPTSRTLTVHIYPLTVAGCVVTDPEDRAWVTERWQAMEDRLRIGVVDKSKQVVEEVWRRTDEFEMATTPERRQFVPSRGSGFVTDQPRPSLPRHNSGSDWPEPVVSYVQNSHEEADGGSDHFARLGTSPTVHRIMTGQMPTVYTVRGSCHWVGVMWDWGWQVLLG